MLVHRNSGKALDVTNRNAGNGVGLQQYTRNDGAWQQWRFVDSGISTAPVSSAEATSCRGCPGSGPGGPAAAGASPEPAKPPHLSHLPGSVFDGHRTVDHGAGAQDPKGPVF